MAVPFELEKLETTGAPVSVLTDLMPDFGQGDVPDSGVAEDGGPNGSEACVAEMKSARARWRRDARFRALLPANARF